MWKWDRPLGPWPSSSSYPIPPEGEWDLVLCGFIFAIIIIIDVVVVVKVFVLNNGDISLIFQDISMKLGGHICHGANSSYHHLWHHMSCCHWIMTENVIKKWTNECTNCEVPGRGGQSSFLPWYLPPCPKHFLYLKCFADLWPDLDIGQR